MTPRERILTLLRDAQGQYFGESVTQLEHALQCADLARASGADNEMILAALLHDIGHLIAVGDETGSPDHDRIGATFLKELRFSERVTELVSGHVQAKRYLAWMEPSYQKQLSSASKHTLAQQGGPMSSEEPRDFEQDRLFAEKIKLRHWDELAKVPRADTEELDSYSELLDQHLPHIRTETATQPEYSAIRRSPRPASR
jgi:2-amino-1-hydroxyethylphosphonate dioxygenase (glycine-forming)